MKKYEPSTGIADGIKSLNAILRELKKLDANNIDYRKITTLYSDMGIICGQMQTEANSICRAYADEWTTIGSVHKI